MINYMDEALKQAKKAYKKDEIPVGCVIVKDNKIIAKGRNNREKKHNVLGHAEINALLRAQKKLKTWKLNDCDLYVTLKPCSMCETIIKQARIKNVYYLVDKLEFKKEYYKTNIEKLNYTNNYKEILGSFFANKRDK